MPPTIRPSARSRNPLLGLPGHQFCRNALAHSSGERSRLRCSERKPQKPGRSSSRIGAIVGKVIAWRKTLWRAAVSIMNPFSRESFGIPRASSEKGFIILTAALQSVFRQAMTLPTIPPIREEDLPGFCGFLSEHLRRYRSPEEWAKAFRQNWCPGKPNNGFLLRADGRIVGGIGAIYAQRRVRGRLERFCNITSWCVLDEFRPQSMRLAMALT